MSAAGFVRVQTTCPSCQGAGTVITNPCEDCRGNGYTAAKVKLDVAIPAGVDDRMRVRLQGEGEPSPDGGPPGDCYCFVSVRPHSIFKRDGKNLILHVPISYCQAALGAKLEVPTLSGPEQIEIPAGTQHGDVFRIRQRGVPDLRGGAVGELLVQVYLEVPKKVSARQETLLRELAELEHTDVTPHRRSFLEKLRDYFAPGGEHESKEE
jgi:molecular chaperone DnaJ